MTTFLPGDSLALEQRGLTPQDAERQLNRFKEGFPPARPVAAATVGQGIRQLGSEELERMVAEWDGFLADPGRTACKFVPASGAASRMFKELFAYLDAPEGAPAAAGVEIFFAHVEQFAFFPPLDRACRDSYGMGVSGLMAAGRRKDVLRGLLLPEGLGFGSMPKGLLPFHRYGGGWRTALTEHLAEAGQYVRRAADGRVMMALTVDEKREADFRREVEEGVRALGGGSRYEVSFSHQEPCTDTLAAGMDNQPLRDGRGALVFRPGGHGALLRNLNAVDADVVFIKNIDNVSVEGRRAATVLYKKALGGLLLTLQRQIFGYLRLLDSGRYTHQQVIDILQFVQKTLCCKHPGVKHLEDTELVIYLRGMLDRPLRVCGMVRNEGEPGGGPFLVAGTDGIVSPQILESQQMDTGDPQTRALLEQGTHFNPVDIVCGMKDWRGGRFDLTRYVDPQTGFISVKSAGGRELKALELPGLWNGSMARWNTVFVEVPVETFTPVKTVNDLLREAHTAAGGQ